MASRPLNLRKQELKVFEQFRRPRSSNPTGGHHLMTARSRRTLHLIVAAAVCAASSVAGLRAASAGEEDDLQREIDTQRVSVADLERLDELKATSDEITLLRSWLDEAWSLRSKHEYDQVREVLERTRKQADLIRAKITASKLRAQATSREASLADVRGRIERAKKALADTIKRKKAIEAGDKQGSASGDKPNTPAGDKVAAPAADRATLPTPATPADKPMPPSTEKMAAPGAKAPTPASEKVSP
jgi:NADH dehydrogenase/NADH:ubiquinone oxidoreductase subunit G